MSRLLLAASAALLIAGSAAAQTRADYIRPGAEAQLPIDAAARALSNASLQSTLYELDELKHVTHQSHWNVVGPNFYALHDMLGEIYARVEGLIDVVAERKRALGAAADARPVAVAQNANLPAFPDGLLNDYDVPGLLSERFATVSQRVETRVSQVSDTDPSTQDVLIDVSREIEKDLWMLRALQIPAASR